VEENLGAIRTQQQQQIAQLTTQLEDCIDASSTWDRPCIHLGQVGEVVLVYVNYPEGTRYASRRPKDRL
jgi:hypothetical protein